MISGPPGVVVLGLNPAVEITYEVPEISPRVLTASICLRTFAGKGTTVACVLAKLGVRPSLISIVPSEDQSGFATYLQDSGVHLVEVPVEGRMRVSVVLRESRGDRQLIVRAPGVAISDPEGVAVRLESKVSNAFVGATHVVVAGSLPPGLNRSTVSTILRQAKARRLVTMVDATGSVLREALANGCSMVKVNRDEFAESFSCDSEASIRKTAMNLVLSFHCEVLITDGSRDAYGVDTAGEFTVPVARAISRSVPAGCGDATMAALAASLMRGLDFRQSCQRAIEVGSLAAANGGPNYLLLKPNSCLRGCE